MNPLPDRQRTDEIKRRLSDPMHVAELLGLTEGAKRQSGGVSVRCPLHLDGNPSCSLTRGDGGMLRVKCFNGCDFGGPSGGGDVLHLVAAVRGWSVKADFARVIQAAAELAGVEAVVVQAPHLTIAKPTAPPPDLEPAWAALGPLEADEWEYLRGRNLDGAADLCRRVSDDAPIGLGKRGAEGYRIACALRNLSGDVVAIQLRPADDLERDERFITRGSSKAGVFGDPRTLRESTALIVAEGLSDFLAASIAMAGLPGVCVLGIAGVENAEYLGKLAVKGKRAVLAFDADGPGDDCAEKVAEVLGKAGARCYRARPGGDANDLCDLVQRGVDLVAFLRGARPFGIARFETCADRLPGERQERLDTQPKILRFGVRFLDRALGGIFPRDAILLGAHTGVGKTELASLIADTNAGDGKRVHYFALEAEDREIERRRKYRLLSAMLHGSGLPRSSWERMNYLDWYAGRLDDLTGRWEAAADKVLAETYKNLRTYYRVKRFSPEDFKRIFREIRNETDLVIVDHFHVIDNEHTSETRGQKLIAQTIADAIEEMERPVILVAHLRKKDARGKRLVPDLDDFHGASDLSKMTKKAILLAPAYDQPSTIGHLWPTYFHLAKCRLDGSRARFGGLLTFNARLNGYEPDFQLGRFTQHAEKFEPVPYADWPPWATAPTGGDVAP